MPYIGSNLLDLRQGYTTQEVTDLFLDIGFNGRLTYIIASAILDTLFPIAYVSFFASIIFLNVKEIKGLNYIVLIPLMAGFIDILENIQLINLLVQFPTYSPNEVSLTSFTTKFKHFFINLLYLTFISSFFIKIYIYLYRSN